MRQRNDEVVTARELGEVDEETLVRRRYTESPQPVFLRRVRRVAPSYIICYIIEIPRRALLWDRDQREN